MNNIYEWVKGETLAKNYLINCGYEILELNYKNKLGEIDIIAKDTKKNQIKNLKSALKSKLIDNKTYKNNLKFCCDTIVFIEVKARKTNSFGNPLEAIGKHKQLKICQVANSYIKQNGFVDCDFRFDCIGVLDDKIEHIKNAFENIY